jgi:hypothetical protein
MTTQNIQSVSWHKQVWLFFLQSFTHPLPDAGLMITDYERSHAHNEELGLNDMKTENYDADGN